MKACNQCGKCCIHWETHRPDIFEYVRDGEIWVSPVTGKPLTKCPWLEKVPDREKYICGIYHDRPDDCKHYPVDIDQMIRDACEMLEPRDLANPNKAQQTLDLLMSDSRPPLSR